MAKFTRKKLKNNTPKKKLQNGIFSRFKLTESYTSLILGAIVVLIAGILFVSFAKINRVSQTSSTSDTPKTWDQIFKDSNTSSTYTVRPGDDLWTISENVYSDGFKWVEIAKLNKLENPGLIHAGDKLTIPTTVQEKPASQKIIQANQTQNSVVKNNSITGNTYTVVSGDNLWDIAVRAYGDGFRWVEISRANNLTNPNLIHPGNLFKIPR
jgi:nucleoid-associated protein YgaU